jgi:hypothetical protein
MANPISGFGRYTPIDHESYGDPIGKAAQSYCKHADTVTAGYLCDEPNVVSNACRSPKNAVDKLVCDDRKMADAQNTIWAQVKNLSYAIVGALMGRSP